MTTERTESITARVPETLITNAERQARQARPDITRSGVIRLALALLARVPAELTEQYAARQSKIPYRFRESESPNQDHVLTP